MRIVVIEPSATGLEHVPFNTEVLKALQLSGLFDEIRFFAERKHRSAVLGAIPDGVSNGVTGDCIRVSRRIRKDVLAWSLVRLILRETSAGDVSIIWLSSCRASIFSTMLARLIGFGRRWRNIYIFHAALAALWGPRRRNPLLRSFDLVAAFRCIEVLGDRVVVLEPNIREELIRRMPRFEQLALLWRHPVQVLAEEVGRTPHAEARIGFLGWAAPHKGFGQFCEMAGKIKVEFGARVSFRVIGHFHGYQSECAHIAALDVRPRQEFWPRDEFVSAARKLDFACLFYDRVFYKYVASGILLDAVSLGIPVIAPRIRLLETIFEEHGEIGLLYDADADLVETVRRAISFLGTERYESFVSNLKRVAESRGARALAERIAFDLCK